MDNESKIITKKKRKKKMKLKEPLGSVKSMKSLKNEISNQNLEEDELRSPNEISSNKDKNQENKYSIDNEIVSSGEKSTKKSQNEKRKIIDRIKMKCCCVYFWFCFSRKKKNIENTLMDEGMKIIGEKLDIINIFKKIHSAELIEQTFKYSENLIEMSEACKRKIHSLYKLV